MFSYFPGDNVIHKFQKNDAWNLNAVCIKEKAENLSEDKEQWN